MKMSLKNYLGWRNWAILEFNSIFENFFIFFYIALLEHRYDSAFIIHVLFFLLFSVISTSYGYLINDFSDITLDREHNKPNSFAASSKRMAFSTIIFLLVFLLLSAIPFLTNPFFAIALFFWLFLATSYSLPPLRYKERGTLGLWIVVIAQRLLPIILLLTAFNFFLAPDIFIIGLYVLLRGFSSDMNHQISDYENDLSTATKTAAVILGKDCFQSIFKFVVELEKILLLILLLWISIHIPYFRIARYSLFLTVFGSYALLYVFNLRQEISGPFQNPHDSQKNLSQVLLHIFPNIIMPLTLLMRLCYYNMWFLIFGLFIILLYRLYRWDTIKQSGLMRMLQK